MAEHTVGDQPLLVSADKVLACWRAKNRSALLSVQSVQIAHLQVESAFVIHLCQGIQFLTLAIVFLHKRLVRDTGQLAEVQIQRIQGIDADGIVGIAIAPGGSLGGVVDGQQLYHAHTGSVGPIHKHAQVAKVACSLAMLATEGEDWDNDTSRFPMLVGHAQTAVPNYLHRIGWQ